MQVLGARSFVFRAFGIDEMAGVLCCWSLASPRRSTARARWITGTIEVKFYAIYTSGLSCAHEPICALPALPERVSPHPRSLPQLRRQMFLNGSIVSRVPRAPRPPARTSLRPIRFFFSLRPRRKQTILVKSARKRRRRRLGQVDIPASDVHIAPDEVLGVGGFGTVYLADYHGLNAAVKVVLFKNDPDEERPKAEIEEDVLAAVWMTDEEAALDQKRRRREAVARAKRSYARTRMQNRQRLAVMRELESMKRLRSPYTVHLHGAVTSLNDRLVLVMELLPGGDLRSRLRRARRPLEEPALRGIVKDVCSGMAFLHAEAFVHGDLKSTNVLFDATGRAKVYCLQDVVRLPTCCR